MGQQTENGRNSGPHILELLNSPALDPTCSQIAFVYIIPSLTVQGILRRSFSDVQRKAFQLTHETQCCLPKALVYGLPVTGAILPRLSETHQVVS